MRSKYKVNEIFYSLQGEGARAGTPNVFIRFSACNLECKLATHGFDCDTDFVSGDFYTGEELVMEAMRLAEPCGAGCCGNVIFTGGEPALQLDQGLVDLFVENGWYTCIETNGTKELPEGIDWVVCSPKPPDDNLAVDTCDELKFVLADGAPIPTRNLIDADHYVVSPAHQADGTLRREDLDWCIQLVKDNPRWRLSVQQHKPWNVR
jgi:organic radical activating enzyme